MEINLDPFTISITVEAPHSMTSKSKTQSGDASAPAAKSDFSLISSEKLLDLYCTMLKCRILTERSRILIKNHKLSGRFHAAAGREAATAGVVIDLLPEDTVATAANDLIPCFIHGLPLRALVEKISSPIALSSGIASWLKSAADAAAANKGRNNNKIVVVFSARESAFDAAWRETLSFAGLHCLAMIFVSWTAQPTQSPTHDSKAKAEGISLNKKVCSFPSMAVDGNDAVAVYRVAHEAIAHARMGHGPTLIDCQIDLSNPGDPILNMQNYLTRKGLFTDGFKAEVEARFKKELDASI